MIADEHDPLTWGALLISMLETTLIFISLFIIYIDINTFIGLLALCCAFVALMMTPAVLEPI